MVFRLISVFLISISAIVSVDFATVQRAKDTFVALKFGGGLVAWGNSAQGGDTSSVSSLISSGVIDLVSSEAAYAALKSTGQVVLGR